MRLTKGVRLTPQVDENSVVGLSNVGSDLSVYGTLQLQLLCSLPPDHLTVRSSSSFEGCPETRCSRRTLVSNALGILPWSSGGRLNSIPPSGMSLLPSEIA